MTVESALAAIVAKIGLTNSNPDIAEDSDEMRQIAQLMNETGEDVAVRADWSRLFKTFAIPAGASVALPADFSRLSDTAPVMLNTTAFRPSRRAMEPEQWALLSKFPSSQSYFYMANGLLSFVPAIEIGGATLRYLSNAWSDAGSKITQNGDAFLIPERLIVSGTVYRWNRQKGLAYDDLMAEHEADIIDEIAMDRGAQ